MQSVVLGNGSLFGPRGRARGLAHVVQVLHHGLCIQPGVLLPSDPVECPQRPAFVSNAFDLRAYQFNIGADSSLIPLPFSKHEIVSKLYPVLKMILIDSINQMKNLRFEDNQKAVSNAHDPHQEVGKRQPEIQPSDRAFIVVIAIKEDRVLCQALKSNNKTTQQML